MIRTYFPKTSSVRAVQYDGTNRKEIAELTGENFDPGIALIGWWFLATPTEWNALSDEMFRQRYELDNI